MKKLISVLAILSLVCFSAFATGGDSGTQDPSASQEVTLGSRTIYAQGTVAAGSGITDPGATEDGDEELVDDKGLRVYWSYSFNNSGFSGLADGSSLLTEEANLNEPASGSDAAAKTSIVFKFIGNANVEEKVTCDISVSSTDGFVLQENRSDVSTKTPGKNQILITSTADANENDGTGKFELSESEDTLTVVAKPGNPLTTYYELGKTTLSWTPVATLQAGTYKATITITATSK